MKSIRDLAHEIFSLEYLLTGEDVSDKVERLRDFLNCYPTNEEITANVVRCALAVHKSSLGIDKHIRELEGKISELESSDKPN